jgi:3-hydroxybutyryl-CoA dehydratase
VNGLFLEDLSVGQCAEITGRVTPEDVAAFAAITGDDNPVHLDEAYAAGTAFGGRIAHGMLLAGYISAVIGTRLPGPGAIYVSQTLRFRRPVRIDALVTAKVEIQAVDLGRARAKLATRCTVDGKVMVDGEAEIMVPRRDV